MMNRTKKFLILGVALSLALSGPPAVRAQTGVPEYEVKAAFLFNFAKFVSWPPEAFSDSHSPIRIGILGEDPFGVALEKTVQNQTISGRSFVIERSRHIQELKDCHILFISRSEDAALGEIFQELKGSDILTIGESENFSGRGGMIHFIKTANKIRFEINIDLATGAGLEISSKLLQLAIVIHSTGSA